MAERVNDDSLKAILRGPESELQFHGEVELVNWPKKVRDIVRD